MISLDEIIQNSGLLGVKGHCSKVFLGISNHSQKSQKGDLFLVLNTIDKKYLQEAINNEVYAILTNIPLERWDNICIPIIYAPTLEENLSRIVYSFYGNPYKKLKFCCGITGTNGKTTIAYLIKSLLQEEKVIQLGTIQYSLGKQKIESSLTTPGLFELASLLKKGVEKGCDSLIMEVSSHALEQKRVDGILYHRAIFTNLSQDHLDYHLNFESYYGAKKKLFEEYLASDGIGIVNFDQEYGKRLIEEVPKKWMTFSKKEQANVDVFLKSYQTNNQGMEFKIGYQNKDYLFKTKLIGEVQLENLLAVITLGFSLNFSYQKIYESIEFIVVSGRLQPFFLNQNRLAIVDYAHTPDALKRVLISLKELNYKRIICVFGCGGNREKQKRRLMGKVAQELSDLIFITNDNPRLEDPQEIVNDILEGIQQDSNTQICLDRKECILKALKESKKGDCILIAGKGHEDYQILGDSKVHLSDVETIKWYQNLC